MFFFLIAFVLFLMKPDVRFFELKRFIAHFYYRRKYQKINLKRKFFLKLCVFRNLFRNFYGKELIQVNVKK